MPFQVGEYARCTDKEYAKKKECVDQKKLYEITAIQEVAGILCLVVLLDDDKSDSRCLITRASHWEPVKKPKPFPWHTYQVCKSDSRNLSLGLFVPY